jgi:NO-binding membrane sensor protein with MHYT domain
MDMGDALLAKVGLWLLGLLPAGIGAAMLVVFRKRKEKLTKTEGLIIFFLGVSIGHFFGHASVDIAGFDHESFAASCIVIGWAVLGFGLLSEIYDRLPGAIKEISDQFPEFLRALWKKILGDK